MIEMKAWERCIAKDVVVYASLHKQLLGKQRIKRSTGQGEETGAKCYIHTLAYQRPAFQRRTLRSFFDAAGLHLQVLLSMKVWCAADSRLQCNFM